MVNITFTCSAHIRDVSKGTAAATDNDDDGGDGGGGGMSRGGEQ